MIGKYYCVAVVFLVEIMTRAAEVSINIDGSQKDNESISSLARSRMLTVPIAKDVRNAEYEHASFW